MSKAYQLVKFTIRVLRLKGLGLEAKDAIKLWAKNHHIDIDRVPVADVDYLSIDMYGGKLYFEAWVAPSDIPRLEEALANETHPD